MSLRFAPANESAARRGAIVTLSSNNSHPSRAPAPHMETRGFQQAIRTATVTYPIPFMVGILLLFALLCFGGSIAAEGAHRWVLIGTAVTVAVVALGILIYAVCVRPDLLRSESHVLMMTITNIIGDKEMAPEQRQRVNHALSDVLGQRRPKGGGADNVRPTNRQKGNKDA
jgi:hypothetical protein